MNDQINYTAQEEAVRRASGDSDDEAEAPPPSTNHRIMMFQIHDTTKCPLQQ